MWPKSTDRGHRGHRRPGARSGAAIQYANFCKVVTPIAKFAMRAGGAKAMIDGGVMVYNGDVVSGLLNITVGALSFRAASKFSTASPPAIRFSPNRLA